jgi:hypothetical protein
MRAGKKTIFEGRKRMLGLAHRINGKRSGDFDRDPTFKEFQMDLS